METRKYEGKDFRVLINRDCMERRYVLSTLERDGTWKDQHGPLTDRNFGEHYGFSPEWPHEEI